MPRLITADQIDFGPRASTPVVSDTLRFVIPVPAFADGGEPLVPPEGSGPFLDWEGNPITGRGVVFYNPDDRCYQAAQGDGKEVVIFGLITAREAKRLAAEARKTAADPNDLTLAQFKALLQFAAEDLGQIAIYNSTRAAVESAMTRVGPDTGIADYRSLSPQRPGSLRRGLRAGRRGVPGPRRDPATVRGRRGDHPPGR